MADCITEELTQAGVGAIDSSNDRDTSINRDIRSDSTLSTFTTLSNKENVPPNSQSFHQAHFRGTLVLQNINNLCCSMHMLTNNYAEILRTLKVAKRYLKFYLGNLTKHLDKSSDAYYHHAQLWHQTEQVESMTSLLESSMINTKEDCERYNAEIRDGLSYLANNIRSRRIPRNTDGDALSENEDAHSGPTNANSHSHPASADTHSHPTNSGTNSQSRPSPLQPALGRFHEVLNEDNSPEEDLHPSFRQLVESASTTPEPSFGDATGDRSLDNEEDDRSRASAVTPPNNFVRYTDLSRLVSLVGGVRRRANIEDTSGVDPLED